MHEDLGTRLEVLLDELLRDQDHAQLGPAVQVQLSDVLLLEGHHAVSVSLTRERFLVVVVTLRTLNSSVERNLFPPWSSLGLPIVARCSSEDCSTMRTSASGCWVDVFSRTGRRCETMTMCERQLIVRWELCAAGHARVSGSLDCVLVSKHALVSVRSQGKLVDADAGVQQEPVEAVEASGEFLRQGRDRLQVLEVAHFRRDLSALLATLSRGILPLAEDTVEPVGVCLLRRGVEVPGPDVLDRGVGRFLRQIRISWRTESEEDLQDCRLAFLEAVMVTSAP